MASNTPSVFLSDPDVTLYHGDVLTTLRELPAESVDCVVTSPPYWGLRDYGTGAWEGGDAGCDHRVREDSRVESSTLGGGKSTTGHQCEGFKDVCPRCGATRIDQQLGLEPTPEQYVERMVEVFREVKRVLAAHGTVWLNLGDSYAGAGYSNHENTGGAQREDGGKPRHLLGSGLKPKDLVGIPWRVAFALQADGWWLRSDIIWAKPNPMPESVTDRPTKSHEFVFLLSKQPRYFFDQEAVREPIKVGNVGVAAVVERQGGTAFDENGKPKGVRREYAEIKGANIRSVWEIATQPYPEAHFATFPEELARRCIAAGCPEQVCRVCGKARERMVETQAATPQRVGGENNWHKDERSSRNGWEDGRAGGFYDAKRDHVGWSECGCLDGAATAPPDLGASVAVPSKYRPGIVLDPFMGSGTVAFVARKLGRHAVGIDLSAEYLALAAKRLQQQSLFAEVPVVLRPSP